MAKFLCSVITPPTRFVSRVPVYAMDKLHAFRYIQDKYASILLRCPEAVVLVESRIDWQYYDYRGVELE